jgi:hypothetical protein
VTVDLPDDTAARGSGPRGGKPRLGGRHEMKKLDLAQLEQA